MNRGILIYLHFKNLSLKELISREENNIWQIVVYILVVFKACFTCLSNSPTRQTYL